MIFSSHTYSFCGLPHLINGSLYLFHTLGQNLIRVIVNSSLFHIFMFSPSVSALIIHPRFYLFHCVVINSTPLQCGKCSWCGPHNPMSNTVYLPTKHNWIWPHLASPSPLSSFMSPMSSVRQCNSPLLPHLSSTVFPSQGCHNKWPQTRWFKIIEMCSLRVLESRRPKLRCWQGHGPSEGSKEEFFLALSASGGYQQSSVFLRLQMHRPSPSLILHIVFVSAFRFPIFTYWGLGLEHILLGDRAQHTTVTHLRQRSNKSLLCIKVYNVFYLPKSKSPTLTLV